MRFRLSLLLIFFISVSSYLFSTPSLNIPISFAQPNGEVITIYLRGDEFYNYKTTLDGFLLTENEDKYLCYSYVDGNSNIINSGIVAVDIDNRTASAIDFLSKIDSEEQSLLINDVATGENKKVRQRMNVQSSNVAQSPLSGDAMKAAPTGQKKVLVVLVEYQDVRFSVNDTQQAFHKMLNEEGYSDNGGTGSARDYFIGCSYGKYTPEFDVYGPILLANNRSYYGYDNSKSCEMASEACDYLYNKMNVDFSQYDNTNDGYIDNIFVFFAGHGEAEGAPAEAVWPFAWYIRSGAGIYRSYNGKILDRFACSNELKGNSGTNMVGIGTFCHEFSHVLGLADYYDTSKNLYTMGSWDIMAGGNYNNNGRTPPYWCSFSRYQVGWMTPKVIKPADSTFVLNNLSTEQAYRISTKNNNEYFLLENRQQSDFDKYLPGHGMLIWHVDYDANAWWNNSPNNDPDHNRLDLVEADGTQSGSNCGGDPFPGTSANRFFSDDTKPNMLSWDGTRQERVIREIYEKNGVINFLYEETFEEPLPPNINKPTGVGPKTITLNWQAQEGADSYEVDIYSKLPNIYTVRAKNVGNVTSATFTTVRPDRTYYYVVRSVRSYKTSVSSAEFSFKTTPEGFNGIIPQITSIEELASNTFNVIWDSVKDADSYNITLTSDTNISDTTFVCDFTNKEILEAGWSTNGTSFNNTSFGAEKPSMRIFTNGINITSPQSNLPISEFSFWYKSTINIPTNKIVLHLHNGYYWEAVDTLTNILAINGDTYRFYFYEPKYYAAKIECIRPSLGTIFIDDVKVKHVKYEETVIEDFSSKNIGDVTSFKYENAIYGKKYNVTLTAQKGDSISYISEPASILMGRDEIIASVEEEITIDNIFYSSTSGVVINNSGNDAEYIIYNMSGMIIEKGIFKDGANVLNLSSGFYMIKVADKIITIVI